MYDSIDSTPKLTASSQPSTLETFIQPWEDPSISSANGDSKKVLLNTFDNSIGSPQVISSSTDSSEIGNGWGDAIKAKNLGVVAQAAPRQELKSCPNPANQPPGAVERRRRRESEEKRQRNLVADPGFDCSKMVEFKGADDGLLISSGLHRLRGRNPKYRFCCTQGPPNRSNSPKRKYHATQKEITPPPEAMPTIRRGCIVCRFDIFLLRQHKSSN